MWQFKVTHSHVPDCRSTWLLVEILLHSTDVKKEEVHCGINPVITVTCLHVPEAWGVWTVLLRDSVPGAHASQTQHFQIRLLLLPARCGTRQPEGLCGAGRYVYQLFSQTGRCQSRLKAAHVYVFGLCMWNTGSYLCVWRMSSDLWTSVLKSFTCCVFKTRRQRTSNRNVYGSQLFYWFPFRLGIRHGRNTNLSLSLS